MKIAVLILLHEFTEQQKRLIEYLSTTFDVYVHVDKHTPINLKEITSISQSVFAFQKYKVYWGHYNQILATLYLFKVANSCELYQRYIFISGSDLPIKTCKQIQDFFENTNKEFLAFDKLPRKGWGDNGGFDRVDYFYAKVLKDNKENLLSHLFIKTTNMLNRKIVMPIQKRLHLKRSHKNICFYGGANWMDLTDNCVSQIVRFVEKNPWFVKRFKYTLCADEIFFQTIICNYVKNIELENKCLRLIDWDTGPEHPRILREEDFNRIRESEYLFARKFNMNIDSRIIKEIFNFLNN